MVRLSLVLSASFLVFWISVLGSTSSLLSSWRSASKALSPRVFELLLWSQIPNYHRSTRKRSTSLAAEPSGTAGGWVSRSDHRHSAALARYSGQSNGGNKGAAAAAAAATTTLLTPLSRPAALRPDAVLSKRATGSGGELACCPQSKLGGNGSSVDGKQQNQRPVSPVPPSPPPAATRSNPYTMAGSDVIDGSEIKPLSNSQAQLRRHELTAGAAALAANARDGRRKASRKLPTAKPMSTLLYRGRSSLSPPDVPVASAPGRQEDAVIDSLPTASAAGLEADEERLDRLSLDDCVVGPATAHRHAKKQPPARYSWLLTTPSAAAVAAVAIAAPATPPVALESLENGEIIHARLPAASALYRKRALALRRASGCPTKTLIAPEELTASAILPEEPNGITSMIAISMVLIFATFVAF
ncbi:hypothetical protein GGF42_007417 [Coemansia sp. RSA 2424]|nr:hypothetical protein GGF42_007417 [Coemansia sp. RSA 2424]